MPMNPTTLTSEIKAALISGMESKGFKPTDAATNGEADKFLAAISEAVATAVITHITTNAQVIGQGNNIFPII